MPAAQTSAKLLSSRVMEMLNDTFAGGVDNKLFGKRESVVLLATY